MPFENLTAAEKQGDYWRKNLRLIGALTAIWFAATFGVIFFAEALSHSQLFGWPMHFYVAAQGSLLVYVLIIWVYAHKMNALDRDLERQSGLGGD